MLPFGGQFGDKVVHVDVHAVGLAAADLGVPPLGHPALRREVGRFGHVEAVVESCR